VLSVAPLPVASPSRFKNLSHKTDTGKKQTGKTTIEEKGKKKSLTHCGRVTKISVFNTVKLGTSASSS
jgi:hypothetical protein